ncbi:MAG: class I SAM-dependent methyltransferase [Bacillota bacterium]|nr:class I SAM-dependent methyltransferase [Bacillota bacterium]
MEKLSCFLCHAPALYFSTHRGRDYLKCSGCQSVMLSPENYLSPAEEKERYDQHNNDVSDPGYRLFVQPLVRAVINKYYPEDSGLDYGAGSGPVASYLLKERGYQTLLYDPFYWPDHSVLEARYNYIICSEVIEHFHSPQNEFRLMRSLLLPGGSLFCMTELYDDEFEFEKWYYKNDPTHVFFYHREAFQWIKKRFGFSELTMKKRLITLSL